MTRLSRSLLEDVFRAVPDAVILVSVSNREILACNPAAEAMFGYPAEELEGRSTEILHVDRDHYERFAEKGDPVIARGEDFRTDFRMRRSDGTVFWTEHVVRVVETEDEGTLAISVARDITERKRTERLVEERSRRFDALISHIQDVVFVVDAGGIIQYLSPSCESVLGYPPDRLVGRDAFLLVHPEDRAGVRRSLRRAVEQPGRTHRVSYRYRHADGRWLHLEAVGTVADEGSGIVGVVLTTRDVTERVEAEARLLRKERELQRAQRVEAIGELTGGVAHDFNNLLTSILGFEQLARDELPDDHPASGFLDEIRRSAQDAARLVENLLAFARKQTREPERIDIDEEIRRTTEMIRRTVGERIDVELDLEEAGVVEVDPVQLRQVVLNLATNARDAMTEGGTLLIATRTVELSADDSTCVEGGVEPGRYARIEVADTGSGIPEQIVDRIFDPFFTTKDEREGTGLGLSMVYGILKQNGGHVWVESRPGEGSTFYVCLPLAKAEAETEGVPGPRAGREDVGSLDVRVLVVEDREQVRRLIGRILREQGATVIEAADGEEAVEVVRERAEELDLVLCDIQLPRRTGREVRERVGEIRSDLPVVLMTGYGGEEVETGETVLRKPFTRESLLQRVREALRGAG